MKFLNQQILYIQLLRKPCALFISLVLLACFLAAGCDEGENVFSGGGEGPDNDPPGAVSGPSVVFSQNAPLAAVLSLTSDEPTEVEVDVTGSAAEANSVSPRAEDFTVHSDGFDTVHAITLLGFHPDSPYNIHVTLRDESGNETELNDVGVVTDPLPVGFPPIHVETSMPELMEPGVTLFPVRASGANLAFGSVFVALDESGQVVWYRRFANIGYGDIRHISNGNFLFIEDDATITEMNVLGDIVRRWHTNRNTNPSAGSILVDIPIFHHEVFEMENGNFLVLTVGLRSIENYPTSDSDPEAPLETAVVAGDEVVEFNPVDGTIINHWVLLDMLDPFRIGYDSLGGFWNNNFPEIEAGTRDWAHANAVIHDPSDDSIIVSMRHQDAVVKFSRQTGQLIWILGTHANWDPVEFGSFLLDPIGDPFLFQYHQHAPETTPAGTILLYDNGNFKASPFETKLTAPENFSRAVEFSINKDTKQVTQVWEFGEFDDPIRYAPFIGDADMQPITGNVLITHGGVTNDAEGLPSDNIGLSKTSVHIIEVTHTTPGEKVFEISIVDPTPEIANGWTTYRSERLPSLYP
ncbi:MAG TPA: aryl-sulfate sulfotransferase [Thermodesulfobacteriota bacterium]|nr:aryl-sulfate sulfotransferase [Thermodesulfobacteriota bacterium]